MPEQDAVSQQREATVSLAVRNMDHLIQLADDKGVVAILKDGRVHYLSVHTGHATPFQYAHGP